MPLIPTGSRFLFSLPGIYFLNFYAIKNINKFLGIYKQNNQLPILLTSPGFGHLPSVTTKEFGVTHRKPYYFFLFMLEGTTSQSVDLQHFEVANNELLFIVPHQIHQLPAAHQGTNYFKLGLMNTVFRCFPNNMPFWLTR